MGVRITVRYETFGAKAFAGITGERPPLHPTTLTVWPPASPSSTASTRCALCSQVGKGPLSVPFPFVRSKMRA
jgi:hypothetical protein